MLMKILKLMFIFIPISFIAKLMNASESIMLILSCLSIVPLAGLMVKGTEEVSFYSGPKIGGLKYKIQYFNKKVTEVTSSMLLFVVIGLCIPALFTHTVDPLY